MTPSHAAAIEAAMYCVGTSYARDLLAAVLAGQGTELECDSLFRTVVLDERWDTWDAAELYYIAFAAVVGDSGRATNCLANSARTRWNERSNR